MARSAIVSVVDDDRDVRESLELLIASLGYDVRLHASAEEFFDAGGAAQCDCVISDVQMPGMKGTMLARRIVAGGKRIPLILMTAFASGEIEREAADIGVDRFFKKPFDASVFADELTELIERIPR